jgi:hypothetical protein
VEIWRSRIVSPRERGAGPTAIHDHLGLVHPDYTGSLSAVKRLCARLSALVGPSEDDVAIPVETGPGEVAQVDFGYVGKRYDPDRGVLRKAWVFVMTLGFSRHMVCALAFDQRASTRIDLHVRAFHVKSSFFATHESIGLPHDEQMLTRWVAEIAGMRRHGTTGRAPLQLFEEQERTALLALPATRWERVLWKQALLHRDSHIQVDGAFYSAPWRLLGDTTLHVLSRDVLGSEDASELGRCDEARVHGEAVKDVASLRTLLPTVVPRPLCARDTIAKLQALERLGRLPLVLATDNGSPYVAQDVGQWLAEHHVVHLLNLPHTPQHNAWIERAFRELEAEAGLGAGLVLDSPDEALLDARRRLEEHRPRACLGGRTAADVDRMLPSWEAAVDRGAFYAAACQARDEALRDVIGARARRRAAREATLSTLERFGLAYRPRGGARLPTGKAEGISCPLQ